MPADDTEVAAANLLGLAIIVADLPIGALVLAYAWSTLAVPAGGAPLPWTWWLVARLVIGAWFWRVPSAHDDSEAKRRPWWAPAALCVRLLAWGVAALAVGIWS